MGRASRSQPKRLAGKLVQIRKGLGLSQNELIRRIAAREFAVIQLRADICDDPTTPTCHILHYRQKVDRFTDEVLYAIDQYYVVARRSTFGSFYVPK